MSRYVKTEKPLLKGVDREMTWTEARVYTRNNPGHRIAYRLTNEDDIVYIITEEGEPIAWVHLPIPKSYA